MSLLFIPRLPLQALALASSQPAAFPVVVAFFQKEMKGKSFDGEGGREGQKEGGRHMSASLPLAASPVMAAQDEQRTRGRRRCRMMSCCTVRT